MRHLLTFIIAAGFFVPAAAAQTNAHVYSSADCAVQFDIPAHWSVKINDENSVAPGEICGFILRPVDFQKKLRENDNVDLYTIEISTLSSGLDRAAHEASFDRRKSGWVVLGAPGADEPAQRLSSPHWTGVKGIATVGCYGAEGYAGMCETPRAVLYDGARTSVIISGGPQTEGEIDRIVASFRFLKTKSAYAADEQWKQVCTQALAQPLPLPKITGHLLSSNLEQCDETALYYGFDQSPDYSGALQCGWYQREHPRPQVADMFYGPGVLTMLYANGRGVPRNYDLAVRFACEMPWASAAENALRIGHLEHMRDTHTQARNFDLCADITSGLNQGACAEVDARTADASLSATLKAITKTLPDTAQALFSDLKRADQEFEETRLKNEIDLTGSGRAAFEADDQTRLREQFVINLQRFAGGDVPGASQADVADLDGELNNVYRQIQHAPASAWADTTVKPEGIRDTERAWIALSEAWIKFAAVAYPKVAPERVRAQLIRLRLHQLRRLLPRN